MSRHQSATKSPLKSRRHGACRLEWSQLACRSNSAAASAPRAGSVLLIVLVVVALLALGAYTFAQFMVIESQATATYGREVQARAAADSGIDLAVSLLEKRYEANPQTFYNDPQRFEGILLRDSTSAKTRSRFSVVSAAESDTSGRSIRYGLFDESSKLNLNVLVAWVQAKTITAAQAETMLTNLSPDVTVEIADAIIDWIDTDQTQMQNGAELDTYQGLTPPYATKDNVLDTLDELLLVRGMTPALLFGEDSNHNGILDPNENDGSASPPLDNADGILQRGLSAFLTVYSREINQQIDGTPRININQTDLSVLYQAVSAAFDADTAKFMVAYRLFGPAGGASGGSGSGGSGSGSSGTNSSGGVNSSGSGSNSSGSGSSGGAGGGSSGGGGASSASSGGKSSGSGSSGSGSAGASSGSSGMSSSSGSGSNSSSSSGGGKAAQTPSVTVAGMDVTKGGKYTVVSLYELFGANTTAIINGASSQLKSPWTTKTTDLQTYAPKLISTMTLTDNPYIDGRININLAPREVLLGIPNMTPTLADSIVGSQIKGAVGQSSTTDSPDRQTTAWLVITGLVANVNALEKLDPFITARGDVFHFQSVGYFDGGGPMARVEAVIDATQTPPQVVFMRDLTELGRGFSSNLLTTGSGSTR